MLHITTNKEEMPESLAYRDHSYIFIFNISDDISKDGASLSGDGIIACNHGSFSDRSTAAVALPLIDSQSASVSTSARKIACFSHKQEINHHRMSERLRRPLLESYKNGVKMKSKQTSMLTGGITIHISFYCLLK